MIKGGWKMAKANELHRKRVSRSWYGDFFVFLMLAGFGAFMVIPMIFLVINAFKPLEEIFIFPPRLYVVNPTLDNFKTMFRMASNLWVPFSRYIFNSVFVSITVTVLHIIFASMAAYPLAKHKFAGRDTIFQVIVLSLLFTSGTLALPQYIVMAKMGMINTYWALILPPVASSLGLFLMKQFMLSIPDSTLESARMDGANEFVIYWKIVMPMVKPAWLTLMIFAFQSIWNSTGGNFIYTESLKLLPTALQQITAGGIARQGVGAAAMLVMALPPIIVFTITQSNVIETMSHSGMKE